MNQVIVLLFGVPVLCIIVTMLCQFIDEMFAKKFVIDRRTGSAGQDSNGSGSTGFHNRRYNDSTNLARHPETRKELHNETPPESPATVTSPIF